MAIFFQRKMTVFQDIRFSKQSREKKILSTSEKAANLAFAHISFFIYGIRSHIFGKGVIKDRTSRSDIKCTYFLNMHGPPKSYTMLCDHSIIITTKHESTSPLEKNNTVLPRYLISKS